MALEIRQLIRTTLPNPEEVVDGSSRIIAYGYGPGYKGVVCTIIPSRTGVRLGIVRGAELADPKGLLEGEGKRHRSVVVRAPSDLKRREIKALLKSAYAAWKLRSD